MTTITIQENPHLKETSFKTMDDAFIEFIRYYKDRDIIEASSALYDLENQESKTFSNFIFSSKRHAYKNS